MIVTETVTINGKEFEHTFSDLNLYIKKEGTEEKYTEAFDLYPSQFTYVETDQQIPIDEKHELKLTRGDVFRGILQAKGIEKAQIRALIEAMPETTPEEKLAKGLALIDFDDALYFYRRNPLINKIGAQLSISSAKMDKFFKTGDYHDLMD